jgi:hypothetical protein
MCHGYMKTSDRVTPTIKLTIKQTTCSGLLANQNHLDDHLKPPFLYVKFSIIRENQIL